MTQSLKQSSEDSCWIDLSKDYMTVEMYRTQSSTYILYYIITSKCLTFELNYSYIINSKRLIFTPSRSIVLCFFFVCLFICKVFTVSSTSRVIHFEDQRPKSTVTEERLCEIRCGRAMATSSDQVPLSLASHQLFLNTSWPGYFLLDIANTTTYDLMQSFKPTAMICKRIL